MVTCEHLTEGTLLQGGKYRIARFIGAGGFGCTYVAEHQLMVGTELCIKELFVQDFCARDATGRVSILTESRRGLVEKLKKKFLDEASALFDFDHPGIVKVYDIFEEYGTAYFTMDYIDGMTLRQLVEKFGPLSEADALEFISQAAEALEYVHSKNRLHLDIKPANIMVDGDGKVKLIDFGVSKQYDEVDGQNTSTLMGHTEGYAPPEQMSRKVTQFYPATDIYALGGTLYFLLTGKTPPSAIDIMVGIETLPPLPDKVSAATRKAVTEAMNSQFDKRPQNIDQWLAILSPAAEPKANEKPKTQATAPAHTSKPVEESKSRETRSMVQPEKPKETQPMAYKSPAPKPTEPQANNKPVTMQEVSDTPKKRKLWPWIVGAVAAAMAVIIIIAASSNDSGNKAPLATADNQMAADSVIVADIAEDDGIIVGQIAEDGHLTAEQIAGPVTTPATQEQPKAEQTPAAPAQQIPQETEIQRLTSRANNGDAKAQYELGLYYDGVSQNYALAAEWFQKAAAQGYADAQFVLGLMYDDGSGVPKDYAMAFEWFRKAAAQGHADAQFELGVCYSNGHGVPKDYAQAAFWLKKADNQGYTLAAGDLGALYSEGGFGIPKDYAQAAFWYKKAAEKGDKLSFYFLGGLYYEGGYGLPQNKEYGLRLMRQAADYGVNLAKKFLAEHPE